MKNAIQVSTYKSPNKNGKIETFEDILDHLGGFGRFQVFAAISILYFEIPIVFTQFAQVFVGNPPDNYICGNETKSMIGNGKIEACTCDESQLYLDPNTIVGEWSLICKSAWVSDFLTTIQMVGMLFGNLFCTQLSDWYGRRYSLLGSVTLAIIGSVISAVSPNPYIFAAGRFFCGVSFAWYMAVGATYSIEFMPPKYRQLCSSLGPFPEGVMLLGLLGYFIRPWRTLTCVTIIPYLVILIVFPMLPESPRWLLQQKKLKELDQVLKSIAKVNQADPIPYSTLESILYKEEMQNSSPGIDETDLSIQDDLDSKQKEPAREFAKVKKSSYLDLLKTPELRRTTICLMAIWFCWAISYFGVSYNIKNLTGSLYLNVFYLGGADRVGYLLALFVCNRLGRCHSLLLFMIISAMFYVLLAILLLIMPDTIIGGSYAFLIGVFCLLGKIGLAGSRSSVRTLTGESYPTSARTLGIGISGIFGSCGAALAPQLAYLGTSWPSVPFFAFALITVCGSLFSFLMTETSGKPLQECSSMPPPPSTSVMENMKRVVRRVSVTSIISASKSNVPV